MLNRVTITDTTFAHIIRWLGARPSSVLVCPAGTSQLPHVREVLVRTVPVHSSNLQPGQARVIIGGTEDAISVRSALAALTERDIDAARAALVIGVGRAAGRVAGAFVHAGTLTPEGLDSLKIPGFICVSLASSPLCNETGIVSAPPLAEDGAGLIWSRTIGALGPEGWAQLTSWRIAVIGCGRTGSLAALSLARLGAARVTLIDPDILELHNVGEMDGVRRADVGDSKAVAIGRLVRSHLKDTLGVAAGGMVAIVPDSILSLSGLGAAKDADILVCCVDNPAARLATAFLAAIYLKPLLDIGTGILRATEAVPRGPFARRMGADIRLVLPGRCLLCLGGIAGIERARTSLVHATSAYTEEDSPPWHRQRAGSLRSLNLAAVGVALRLLEDLAGGRIRRSLWLHLEFFEEGIPVVEERPPQGTYSCGLCGLAAGGDAALGSLRGLLMHL
jgi:hypothetical protein